MERNSFFLLLTVSSLLCACSMDLRIVPVVEEPVHIFNKPLTAELVSGSTQYEHSNVRGYLVQASVGALTTDTLQKSNIRQYKIYQGVQAQMISEDPR